MTVDMDPAATFAVVVGIERYDAGWSLDGAANDALRAARWLRESGVPADRVRLAIDPLPDNRDRVRREADELGLTVREAGRDDLIDLFTKDLTGAEGRHLVVFWSGHGVLDEQHTRALFTADAHAGDQRTLRVDDLLVFLRDNEVRGFHDQIVIMDACANFAAEMKSRTSLTYSTFPVSRGRPGVRQFVLYAASQGELAGHNQAGKYGEFSRAVLDALHSEAGPQWPADMPALSATVAEHFGQLREDGRSQAHPVFFSTTDWAGNETRSSYGGIPIPGTSREAADKASLTASQLRRLVSAFADSPFTLTAEVVVEAIRRSEMRRLFARLAATARSDEDRLAVVRLRRKWELQQQVLEPLRQFQGVPLPRLRTYYDVVPDRQLAPRLTELDEVLEHLAEFGTADESVPLHRFVARLELFTDVRVSADWFKLTATRLRKLRATEKRAVTTARSSHLVLHLPGDQWPAEVSGHLLTTDGQWAKRTVACPEDKDGACAAVNKLITWAHESALGELALGFLVSRARFDDVPEHWTYVDDLSGEFALAEEYPTVLHSGDRMRVPRARNSWRRRAQEITEDLQLAEPEILWIDEPLDSRQITKIVRTTTAACVVFAAVPGRLCGALRGDPIVAAINPGTPYLIWLDEPPADLPATRELIDTLVRNGPFDGVPRRTLDLRQDAGTCPGLRVLWDDTELLPRFGQLTGIEVRTA